MNTILPLLVAAVLCGEARAQDPVPPKEKPKPKAALLINGGATTTPDRYVVLRIAIAEPGAGVVETATSTDGTTWTPWFTFGAHAGFELSEGAGARTIFVKVRDKDGTESEPVSASITLVAPVQTWSGLPVFRLAGGIWSNGFLFEAVTPAGPRTLDSGTMGVVRLELAFPVRESLAVTVGGEYAQASDATVMSAGVDLELTLFHGDLLLGDGSLDVFAGMFASKLEADVDGFGTFDPGAGFRGGIAARIGLSAALSADATLEFRHAIYSWSDPVLSGDDAAVAAGAVVTAGLSYRF